MRVVGTKPTNFKHFGSHLSATLGVDLSLLRSKTACSYMSMTACSHISMTACFYRSMTACSHRSMSAWFHTYLYGPLSQRGRLPGQKSAHTSACMCFQTRMCARMCSKTCMSARMCSQTCMCARMCACLCSQTRMRTHMCAREGSINKCLLSQEYLLPTI